MRQRVNIAFALVMLVCLFLIVMDLWQIKTLTFEVADSRNYVEILEGKMRRQQSEYDMLVEALPRMREENAALVPASEEALAQEKDLKAQRRALRKEIEKLEEELAELKQATP